MTIIIEVWCNTQFAVLLSIYKRLKIHFKIFFVLSNLLMAAPFSYHLGLVALITTVLIAGSTMAYLYIQQQHAIDRIQSTLYNICLYCWQRWTRKWFRCGQFIAHPCQILVSLWHLLQGVPLLKKHSFCPSWSDYYPPTLIWSRLGILDFAWWRDSP